MQPMTPIRACQVATALLRTTNEDTRPLGCGPCLGFRG